MNNPQIGAIGYEFPRYETDTLPPIPDEWKPAHWHNDLCPSWIAGPFRVWIDHADPMDREEQDSARFAVSAEGTCTTFIQTDDWAEVLRTMADPANIRRAYFCKAVEEPIFNADHAAEFMRKLHAAGLMFHMDDDPAEVMTAGDRTFTDDDCRLLRYRVAEVKKHHPDPHQCALDTINN